MITFEVYEDVFMLQKHSPNQRTTRSAVRLAVQCPPSQQPAAALVLAASHHITYASPCTAQSVSLSPPLSVYEPRHEISHPQY